MNKYQQLLIKNIRKTLEKWAGAPNPIVHEEVYRFLHSIKGTAATIGLEEASDVAYKLMEQLTETDTKTWTKKELHSFLTPLISLFYYEGYQNTVQKIGEEATSEEVSLVLLFEKDPIVIMQLKDFLEAQNHVVMTVAHSTKICTTYLEINPKVMIIGGQLEKDIPENILEDIYRHAFREFIPLVILDKESTSESRVEYYLNGADDVIPDCVTAHEQAVRIHRFLQYKKRIDQNLIMDELTQVYNRKYLANVYAQLINKFKRQKEPFSVVMLDIDHFKKVNDTYGHVVGDMVLQSLAHILKKELRPTDTVIRYGGEEFLVLLPRTRAVDAKRIMERILHTFRGTIHTPTDAKSFSCTFSAGVQEVSTIHKTLTKHIELADQALYRGKQAGRNIVLTAADTKKSVLKKQISVSIIDDDPIIRSMLIDFFEKSKLRNEYTLEVLFCMHQEILFLDGQRQQKKILCFIAGSL